MAISTALVKAQGKNVCPAENLKGIKNHKRAAAHSEAAAKHHLEAAKHHASGDHQKAAQSTIIAQGFHHLAGEAQIEDIKHHALSDEVIA